MSVLFYSCSFILGLFSLFHFYIKNSFNYWRNNGVPSLPAKFPRGNLTGNFLVDLKRLYSQLKSDEYPFFGAYFSSQAIAVITDLDLIPSILIKDFEYFLNRGMYYNEKDDPLSANLICIEADKWKNQRTKISPAFSSGKMKFMFSTVKEIGHRLTDTVENLNEDFDFYDVICRYTVDVIGAIAFGLECNSLVNPDSEFLKYGYRGIDKREGKTFFKMLLKMQTPKLARWLKIKDTPDDVTEFFKESVNQTIDYRFRNNVRRNDFMDIMIEMKSKSKLSFNEMLANCYMFFSVGYDTSSITLAFCMYELVLNQNIQEKLRNEINLVLNKYEGELTYEGLMEMSYLDQVVKETIRKYPAIIMLGRVTAKNYKVPNTSKVIEKGVPIIIPVYEIHHDSKYFPNPEIFDPDRFSPEVVKERHSMAFLGFGDGPRNCIGLRFAQMQTKIALVSLLKKFKFYQSDKLEVPLNYNLKRFFLAPESKVWIKAEKL